ncbi:MAG: Hsp70 family protein [Planctomycetota bacterium]|nr:Hsp70 family protein [Planctomycetota bacterium]
MTASGPIVGIDLGTTNSLVAIADARGPRVIPDDAGRATLPSVVHLGLRAVEVGHDARARAHADPGRTIASVKRLMGRSAAEVSADAPFRSYEVVPGEHGSARVRVPGEGSAPDRVVTPEEVSAMILRALKARAERALGEPVTRAVITVPAYFDDAQRQATRAAGQLAGLDVVRLVPEPTAAALAYGIGAGGAASRRPSTIVVYDLGGGTFDVSVLRLLPATGDEPFFFRVLGVGGDTRLGGDDFDRLLAARLDAHARAGGVETSDVRTDLLREAERVKIELSAREAARARVEHAGGVLEPEITRAEFEELIAPLVERTIESCRRTLLQASGELDGAPVDAVVLVGGSSRLPLVRRRVQEFFGIEPYTALDPEQVVALGAAVQAQILSGARRDALLLDVIPLSLGIETAGGGVAKIIMQNATIPAVATEMFSTQVDGQTAIRLTVVQGEREMAADCRTLGEFHLRGIPPMPAGLAQVEVKFLVDANGVLHVSARERRSGKAASLQVIPTHGLSAGEIERIERESLAHAREDMTRRRVADLVAAARLDVGWIGASLERHRAALDPAYAADLDARLAGVRALIASGERDWRGVDTGAFSRAKGDLEQASLRLQEVAIAASLRADASSP